MIIPSKIALAGLDIEITILPTLHADKGLGGYADYPNLRIFIAGDISLQLQETTFLHETIHFCLFVMGENEKMNDEKFVDLLSIFLHQAFKEFI